MIGRRLLAIAHSCHSVALCYFPRAYTAKIQLLYAAHAKLGSRGFFPFAGCHVTR